MVAAIKNVNTFLQHMAIKAWKMHTLIHERNKSLLKKWNKKEK